MKSAQIVIADDHLLFCEAIAATIESRNESHTVVGHAETTSESLQVISKKRPNLVLIGAPSAQISLAEILRHCSGRGRDRNIPCLVLSSSSRREHLINGIRLGAAGYLLKTSTFNDLFAAIDAILSGTPYFHADCVSQLVEQISKPRSLSPVDELTPREITILAQVAEGLSTKEIAAFLTLSPKTVNGHRSRIMQKLQTHKIADLVRLAVRAGLVIA